MVRAASTEQPASAEAVCGSTEAGRGQGRAAAVSGRPGRAARRARAGRPGRAGCPRRPPRAELPGEVGDGGLGAGGEPAAGQHQGGGLALARLHEPLGGARVDGDADRAGVPGQQFEGGLGVQAAQGAGADVRDAGERARRRRRRRRHCGASGKQRVDLFGAGGVVEQEQQRRRSARAARSRVARSSSSAPARGGHAERGEQFAGGALDRHGRAVGLGETGAQHSVGIAVGDLPDEFLGERGAAGAGPAGDQEHARARGLPAGDGVQPRALDVGAQFLQLPGAAQEMALCRSVSGQLRAACVHCLIRHGPHSRPTAHATRRDSGSGDSRA